MSKLSAFLHPKPIAEKEITLSDRFVDEAGELLKFKLRGISQKEHAAIIDAANKPKTVDGVTTYELDQREYNTRLVLAALVEPCLTSSETCKEYGVADPMLIPGSLFSAGEFTKLTREISKLSGFGNAEAEAKN